MILYKMKIIRINKNGSMNELDLKIPKNCLNVLKKNSISCGNGNIKELYFWKYDGKNIKCYGWYDGESGFENKHELAPNGTSTFLEEDSSSKLLFGDLFILCLDTEKKYNDFGVDDYSMFYEIINEILMIVLIQKILMDILMKIYRYRYRYRYRL